MGRNTHGAKHRKVAPPAEPPAAPTDGDVVAADEDEAPFGGAAPEDAAAAVADKSAADAAAIERSREARRCEKKAKRRARLEAEAADKAAAIAAGQEPPLSAKEARRAERRRAEEERLAAKEAKQAAWNERRAAADAAFATGGGAEAAPQAAADVAPVAAATAAAAVADTAAPAEAAAPPVPAEPPKEVKVPNKIFVGGLPFTKTPQEIQEYFEAYGEVADVDCLTFPDSGRFRGIAMVRFADEAGFHAALALNGIEWEDRVLTIKRAKAKAAELLAMTNADGTPGAAKAARPVAPLPLDTSSRVAYVGNLPWEVDEESLGATFEGLPIENISWGFDKATGDFKGYAHVTFATAEHAAEAQKRNGTMVLGRPMRVAPETKRLVPRSAAEAAADAVAAAAAAAPAAGVAVAPASTRAYVTGLPYDAAEATLEAAIRTALGPAALRVRLGRDRATSALRGYAHVDFADAAALDAAVTSAAATEGGLLIAGRPVRVTHALEKLNRPTGPPPVAQAGKRAPAKRRGSGGGKDMAQFEDE